MEFRPFYMSRGWVREGHKVLVLAASYSHIRSKQPIMGTKTSEEIIDGVNFRWYETPKYNGNGLGRIKNMLHFLWSISRDSKNIVENFKPDIVIASSTYPLDIFPAHKIAKKSQAKLVFEVHDLWPLTPIELGGFSKWNPLVMIIQFAEDFAYRKSNKVVSMLPNAKSYMVSRGMEDNKFIYIPNGVDKDDWTDRADLPQAITDKIQAIRSEGKVVLGFSGTHGLANALDLLLDVAKIIQGRVSIVMVGQGPEKQRLCERLKNEGIDNVHMYDSISKQSIPSFLEMVDISYIGMLPQSLYRFGISPNKLMDYMMAAKPIVMSINAGNDMVSDVGCGLTVKTNDKYDVAIAVLKIANLGRDSRIKMGLLGKKYVMLNHSYDTLPVHFLEELNQ